MGLLEAADKGDVVRVEHLASAGARICVTDEQGQTSLKLAAIGVQMDVVRSLDGGEADVDARNGIGWTPLMVAASSGRLDEVRFLVEHGADVDASNRYGETSIIWAAKNDHWDVVRFLLEHGAAVDGSDRGGETPLLRAAAIGHLNVVRIFVEHGAAVDGSDEDGQTPIMRAAENGHLEVVRFLVESGATVDGSDNVGWTPMIWAAGIGHLDVVRIFVEHGAAVDGRDNDGWTPMMWAARGGHLDVVRYLVEHGAGVDASDSNGRTPMLWAVRDGHLDVVRFLLEHGAAVDGSDSDGWTPIMSAAGIGHLDVVRFFVEHGAAVDGSDSDGWTPMMRAAENGHLDVVRFLLEHGAAVDGSDCDGQTPMIWAAGIGHLDVVRFFVEHGAAVDGRDSDGWTPMMWAARGGHLDVVRFLLEHGADVNASDRKCRTPMMWAARDGHLDVVRFLLEHGAAVDGSDCDGQTPMMWAAGIGHLDVVCYLVEHGAGVDARDSDGWTPMMWAARDGHLDVVRYLVEHGAAVDASDCDGQTPMMWAARDGHLDVVRFFVEYGVNPNLKSTAGVTALSNATEFGRQEVVQFLLPFVRYQDRRTQTEHLDAYLALPSNILSTWVIEPFEIEVESFVDAGHIGGDFRGKWLDADVVVKLFIDDTTSATFVDEVRLWHQLRHPNVLKLYGICNSHHRLLICEYASNGSLPEFLKSCDSERRTPWKFLYEAALGLEYLHERNIVHGNLRGSNILIGSDGLAKLSGFGLSTPEGRWHKSGAFVHWASPEILKGNAGSPASDVYTLGMCIIEAVSRRDPFCDYNNEEVLEYKKKTSNVASMLAWREHLTNTQAELVVAMCSNDPSERLQMPAIVKKLEEIAKLEAATVAQLTEPESQFAFDEFDHGKTSSLWIEVRTLVDQSMNAIYRQIYQDLEVIYNTLKAESHLWSTLQRFDDLLIECRHALDNWTQQNQIRRLSESRARDHSVQSLHRRIIQLLLLVRPQDHDAETRETEWKRLCRDQAEIFVSDATGACVLLSSVDSEEDRLALVAVLRAELRNRDGKYTKKQLAVLRKTYDDIVSKSFDDVKFAITPEWFIPWFELEMNEMMTLGEGGFGSVIKAKWLDSEVVVKKLEIDPKDAANSHKKREMRKMFEREVDIWFGLSHPHVVRLFGACHVGRPFFVCELAPNGTLIEYLHHNPDDLWVKLREAALGVQYLHARGIVHGDLKGNNIMIGSDGKSKVTDFGLSGVFGDDSTEMVVSGAWHWVAPECLLGEKPTFASDIYSLGMCIIEALRVTKADQYCLPWGDLPNPAVKFNVTRRHRLPPRPQNCSDEAWTLIEHMCKSGPANRMLIMTVVDELKKLADRQGDLSSEADEMFDNIGEVRRSPSSVADELAEMKSWTGKCDAMHGWEGGVLENIHQLLWDRLHQVGSQLMPDDEDIIDFKAPIIDFSTLVEHSKQRTRDALNVTGAVPLIKFTELALGGYALHRRLDKFMAAHAVANEPSSLHDWTSACRAFMEGSVSPTPGCSIKDYSANKETDDGTRTSSSTEVVAAL